MNKSTSLYLDLLRVIAAFGVLIGHANFPWFSNNLFPGDIGHKLVLIFFVLSGYLIAFTVYAKNKGSKKYLIDRLSRLYSVVLPALIFTYLIDFVGKHINPGSYISQIAPDHQIVRFLLNATYLQQIWGLSTKPSSNGAFWSISYEFWYYILFWAFCYFQNGWKYLGILIICLIVGIKILLLFPVWVFGVIAYYYHNRLKLSSKIAFMLFLISLGLIFVLTFFWDFTFFSNKFILGKSPLYFSSNFIFDWVFGLFVAFNIFCFTFILFSWKAPVFIAKFIKYLSSITFSLYLYHQPTLVFIAAVIPYNRSSYFQIIPLLIALVVVVAVLSEITEKQRNNWKILIERIFLLFSKREIAG